MSRIFRATSASAFLTLILGCAGPAQFVGNPPQDINADLVMQQQSGAFRTNLEDDEKFKMVFFDIPSYQRLLDVDSGNVSPPMSRTTVPPKYPRGLSSVRASVKVGFVVAEDGTVEAARVLQASDSRFSEAAIECVKQWTFYPGLRDGKADKSAVIIEVKFDGRR